MDQILPLTPPSGYVFSSSAIVWRDLCDWVLDKFVSLRLILTSWPTSELAQNPSSNLIVVVVCLVARVSVLSDDSEIVVGYSTPPVV